MEWGTLATWARPVLSTGCYASPYLFSYDNPNPNLNNFVTAYMLRLTANGLASNAVHHTRTATDLRAPMLDFVTLLVSVYHALDHLWGMVPCQGTLKHSHEDQNTCTKTHEWSQ